MATTANAASASAPGGSSTASSTSYASSTAGTAYAAPSTSATMTSTSEPAIQTVPFTGQALLVGTCSLPQFTILTFPDGGSIEVPLIGCSDDRPDCCPSLNSKAPEASGTASEGEQGSTTSAAGSTTGPTPTGVVSMLSKNPLTVCPSDMVDLDPVCCPVGFSRYGQHIIGNLPCYSTLTTTVYSPDASVLASITSVVASSLEAASTTATPTISVIVNQVFALGLPCADDDEEKGHSGLSTGAKAGIGVGIAVGAILLILGIVACCLLYRRRKKKRDPNATRSELPVPGTAGAASPPPPLGGPDGKHFSTASTMTPGTPVVYPQPQSQPQMHQYSNPNVPGVGGYSQSHGYSPAFGPSQQSHILHDQYGGVYSIQPVTQPGMPTSPQQQQYPYQYNNAGLPTGQPAGPYSPTFHAYSPPPVFMAGRESHYQPQMNQSNSDYGRAANASSPVEADSGSFRPSSLSPSPPGLSTASPPASHGQGSGSQPTSSLNGGQSAAELSSHDSGQRPLIARKSVPSHQEQ